MQKEASTLLDHAIYYYLSSVSVLQCISIEYISINKDSPLFTYVKIGQS